MRIPVVISPASIVRIVRGRRCDAIECPLQIGHTAWLVFKRRDAECRSPSGDICNPRLNTTLAHDCRNMGCDVDHVTMSLGRQMESSLVSGHTQSVPGLTPAVNT